MTVAELDREQEIRRLEAELLEHLRAVNRAMARIHALRQPQQEGKTK